MSAQFPGAGIPADANRLIVELSSDPRFAERVGWTLLGTGGFGAVFRVEHRRLARREAVKVLWRPLNPTAVDDFQREARLLGGIGPHPALIAVYDAGVLASGRPFLVAEHAPGGSMADRTAAGRMPWRDALDVVLAVAGGLHRCHEAGVLHLDIKPSNILLDADGRPRLADFGVARSHLRSGFATETAAAGTVASTIAFAPPELLEGRATPASDVYMLAATFHALCTGSPPSPRRLDLKGFGVPRHVAAAIDRALAVDPAQRPQSVAAFATDLSDTPSRRPAVGPRVAAAVAVIVGLVAGAWLVFGRNDGPGDVSSSVTGVASSIDQLQTATSAIGPPPTPATDLAAPQTPTASGNDAATTAPCDSELAVGVANETDGSGIPLDDRDIDLRTDAATVQVTGLVVLPRFTSNGRTVCAEGDGQIVDLEVISRSWGGGATDGNTLTLTTARDVVTLEDVVEFSDTPSRRRIRVAVSSIDGLALRFGRGDLEETVSLDDGVASSDSPLVLRRDPEAPFVSIETPTTSGAIEFTSSPAVGGPTTGSGVFVVERVVVSAVDPHGSVVPSRDLAYLWVSGSAEFTSDRPGWSFSPESYLPFRQGEVTFSIPGRGPIQAAWYSDPDDHDPAVFGGWWVAEVPWDATSVTVTISPGALESDIAGGDGEPVFDGSAIIELELA